MTTTKTVTTVCAATVLWAAAIIALAPPAQAKPSCVLAGGQATMVTPDLARFMANAALNNQMAANGWKAAGVVKVSCKTELLTHCVAQQRACK
jgi:putative intracellular protease/amidase